MIVRLERTAAAAIALAVGIAGCTASRGGAPRVAAPPASVPEADKPAGELSGTFVVMLGTDTPNPDPERSGPALTAVAGGRPYLVDCGDGVVRRAEAARRAGVEACDGCDVLVHEVYAKAGWDRRTPDWQAYHAAAHTSGIELGELAARARPKLLMLTHQLLWGATEEQLLAEIRRNFDGEIAFADDLAVY